MPLCQLSLTQSASLGWRHELDISELQSQPKVSGHPQKKALPRFPFFNVAPMMSTFLSTFFEPAKQHWSGGLGEKGSHCPMLLSEIVARDNSA